MSCYLLSYKVFLSVSMSARFLLVSLIRFRVTHNMMIPFPVSLASLVYVIEVEVSSI